MDHEAQKKKRMEELEAKRKRLEEMRKMRQTRATEQAAEPAPAAEPAVPSESSNVEDLVNSLLTEPVGVSNDDLVNDTTQTPGPAAVAEYTTAPLSRLEIARMRAAELTTVSDVIRIHIEPVTTETYSKECQTDEVYDDDNDRNSESGHTPHRRARAESNSMKHMTPPPPAGTLIIDTGIIVSIS
jgi:hypothetical protein